MGFFNQEVELIIPPKKQNNKTNNVKVKTLNGYDAIREKLDEHNTFIIPIYNNIKIFFEY